VGVLWRAASSRILLVFRKAKAPTTIRPRPRDQRPRHRAPEYCNELPPSHQSSPLSGSIAYPDQAACEQTSAGYQRTAPVPLAWQIQLLPRTYYQARSRRSMPYRALVTEQSHGIENVPIRGASVSAIKKELLGLCAARYAACRGQFRVLPSAPRFAKKRKR
jgi:hypothetical protein